MANGMLEILEGFILILMYQYLKFISLQMTSNFELVLISVEVDILTQIWPPF